MIPWINIQIFPCKPSEAWFPINSPYFEMIPIRQRTGTGASVESMGDLCLNRVVWRASMRSDLPHGMIRKSPTALG